MSTPLRRRRMPTGVYRVRLPLSRRGWGTGGLLHEHYNLEEWLQVLEKTLDFRRGGGRIHRHKLWMAKALRKEGQVLAEEAANSFVTFSRNPRWVLGCASRRPLEATLEFGRVSEWPRGLGWWCHAKSFCPSQYKAPQHMRFLGALGSRFLRQGSEASPETWARSLLRVPAKCSRRVFQQSCPQPKLEKDRKRGVGGHLLETPGSVSRCPVFPPHRPPPGMGVWPRFQGFPPDCHGDSVAVR